MDTLCFCGWSIFEPKDIEWSQVRQKCTNVTSTVVRAYNAVLRTEESVVDDLRRYASWEVVDFEVAQSVDPMCAQNLCAIL